MTLGHTIADSLSVLLNTGHQLGSHIRAKFLVIIPFPIFSNFSSDGYFAFPGVSLILFPFLFTALTSISIKLFSPIRNGTFDSGTSGVPFKVAYDTF